MKKLRKNSKEDYEDKITDWNLSSSEYPTRISLFFSFERAITNLNLRVQNPKDDRYNRYILNYYAHSDGSYEIQELDKANDKILSKIFMAWKIAHNENALPIWERLLSISIYTRLPKSKKWNIEQISEPSTIIFTYHIELILMQYFIEFYNQEVWQEYRYIIENFPPPMT